MGSNSSKTSKSDAYSGFSKNINGGTEIVKEVISDKTEEWSSAMREKAEMLKDSWTESKEDMQSTWRLINLNYDVLSFYQESVTKENAFILLLVLGGTGLCIKLVRWWLGRRWLDSRRSSKQEQRRLAFELLENKIKTSEVTEERKNEIKKLTFMQLRDALQSGEVSAVEALHTYQSAALEAHKRTNCLVEPIWEAETWALDCDLSLEKKGPLHGMPVSIKDNFGIEGYDCTIGLAKWIDWPFDDSVIVKVLKKQGAIPFVKTNVPQTMISWDTSNPIFGPTTNPHQAGRTVGGSSGGEAALIAGGGSLVGVGGDIGGSIRIPCNMCGIYGFKPTAGRISSRGAHPMFKGQNAVLSIYGPMAQDMETLVEFMRTMMVPHMWELDPNIIPVSFREELYNEKKKVRIGYYDNMNFFHAVPACKRAVREAKIALERAGYELVPWEYPQIGEKTGLYWTKSICGDRGERLLNALKDDRVDGAFKSLKMLLSIPLWLKKLICMLLLPMYPRAATLFKAIQGCKSVNEWWELVASIDVFKQQVSDSLHKEGVTALLSPGMACPAVPNGIPGQIGSATVYTQVFNVLNLPTGSVPVTKVTAEDVASLATYPTMDPWHKLMKKSMAGTEGLPVNVQISTLGFQDETCLRIMTDLDNELKKMRSG